MMINVKYKALFFTLSVMIYNAAAQEKQSNAFSLQQSIDYAYKNSPSYLNAELDVKNALYRKKEIAGLGLPQVSGSFDFKDYFELPASVANASTFNPNLPNDIYQVIRFGIKYNATAGLSASQLLFSSDYIFGLSASKEFIKLSTINVTRTKAELVSQVSKAYYSVIINKERIKLIDANIINLKTILDNTTAFNRQGFVEAIDVERLEVAYNNLTTEKEKIQNLISLSENLLKFQMGYKITDPLSLSDSLSRTTSEELDLSKINVSNRPELLLLQSQQKLYDLDIKRLKWGYLPTIAAYGAFQYNTFRLTPNIIENDKTYTLKQWYSMSLIGVTVNINVFDGFQRHYKIQQANITSLKNKNDLKNLELATQLEASSAATMYANALSSLKIQKRNMELAQNIYRVSQKKYEQGVGSNLEIINAQTSLKEAETNYYNAIFDMLVYKVDYLKATGTLVK